MRAGLGLLGLGLCACAAMPPSGGGEPASIAGTRWVDAVSNPQAMPRLEFAEGGRLAGHTGCNALTGTWSEAGGVVSFGVLAMTKRFCVGPAGDTEKRLLAALGDGSRARREGGKLVVTSPSGARFEFTAAAAA